MGKTTQQTTQSNSPPANVLQNYQDLVNRAQGVANTPYQQYQGQIVPDLTADQLNSMRALDLSYQVAPQYYNQAQNYLNSATNPINLSAGNTSQYVSPYSQTGAANATAAGQGLANFGTNAGQNIANFGTSAGQSIANYGTGAGQGIGNYAYNIGASGPQLQQYNSQNLQPFLDPYTQSVINATGANIDRSNSVQQNNLTGSAIKAGNAFGGDRAGVAAAELARNQDLAKNQVMAQLQSQGFQNAQSQFNTNNQQALAGQQTALSGLSSGANLGLGALSSGANIGLGALSSGANLGVNAQQAGANLGLAGAQMGNQGYQNAQQLALAQQQAQNSNALNAGNSMANLGTSALNSYLASANAGLQSGNLQQQQWAAQLQVPYQQFLQQQAYPFQTTQFLQNAVLGTGTASGGTGTTTSPGPNIASQVLGLGATAAGAFMASDERVKQNKEVIGRTFDGQPIYRFNYVGHPTTQLGLMAQNVEHSHPDAVAEHGGLKYVNYDAATDQAADKGHFAEGGVVGLSANAPGLFQPIDFTSHGIRGYVPDAGQIKLGAGPPKAPNAPGASAAPNTNALGSALGKGLAGMGGEGDFVGSPGVDSGLPMIGSAGDYAVPTFMASGGLVAPDAAFQGFADGGMLDEIDQTDLPPLQGVSPQAMDDWRKSSDFALNHPDAGNPAMAYAAADASGLVPMPRQRPAGIDEGAPAGDIPPAPAAYNVADRQPAAGLAAASPDAAAPAQSAPSGGLGAFLSSMFSPSQANAQSGPRPAAPPNMGQALMAAGLGMMSSRSPTLLGGVGEGGAAGLQNYMAQQKEFNELDKHPVVDHSGPTTRIYYPSTKQWIDTGLPTINAAQQATLAETKRQRDIEERRIAESERHNRAAEAEAARQHTEAIAATNRLRENQESAPVKIGVDPLTGGDRYGVRDPNNKGLYLDPVTGKPIGTTSTNGQNPDGTLKTGEDFLKTLPSEQQSIVKKIANYEIPPTSLSIKGGHREMLLAKASQYNPDYDGAQYPARADAVKKFSAGQQGNAVRSFNVAVSHLSTLDELTTALNNKDVKVVNQIANKFKDQFGYTAPSNFEAAKGIVGDEIVKAILGSGGGALADREEIKKTLDAAKTPDQLRGVIKTYKELMAGQLHGLKKQYEDTTRLKNFDDKLTPETRREMEAAGARAPTAQPGAVAAPTTSTPPKVRQNGHTYERQSDGSYKAID